MTIMRANLRIATAAGTLAITLLSTNTRAMDPLPDLKVAGMDGWVTVTASDIVAITAGLDAGDRQGDEVELWLVAGTSQGNFSYNLETGWTAGVQPGWQGPLSGWGDRTVTPAELMRV